jgi:hypothetical protein
MKPSAAAVWHFVWHPSAAPFGDGRRIWRALAMISAVHDVAVVAFRDRYGRVTEQFTVKEPRCRESAY